MEGDDTILCSFSLVESGIYRFQTFDRCLCNVPTEDVGDTEEVIGFKCTVYAKFSVLRVV